MRTVRESALLGRLRRRLARVGSTIHKQRGPFIPDLGLYTIWAPPGRLTPLADLAALIDLARKLEALDDDEIIVDVDLKA